MQGEYEEGSIPWARCSPTTRTQGFPHQGAGGWDLCADYVPADNDERLNVLRSLLRDVAWLLESSEVEYYIAGGSLLGAVRGQDLIPYEWNADFNVPAGFVLSAALQKLAWQRGIIVFDDSGCFRACYCGAPGRQRGSSLPPWKEKYVPFAELHRCPMPVFEEKTFLGEKTLLDGCGSSTKLKYQWKLQRVRIQNISVWSMDEAAAATYLKHHYGDNYLVPRMDPVKTVALRFKSDTQTKIDALNSMTNGLTWTDPYHQHDSVARPDPDSELQRINKEL